MATVQALFGNLPAGDRHILTAVNGGASSLSLLGSGFIVLCYLCFKELRKFSFKLVFFLALSDMLYSFFSIVGDPSKGFFCYAQAYSTHFFCVASFLWTTTIAFTLHRTVVRHKTDVEDMEPIFHLYVWGTSLVMTVIRSISNEHGHLGGLGAWCWTQTGRTGKVVHFITFYVPLWGAIVFNGVTYFQVIRMLNNATRMAVDMSNRAYQQDARGDKKDLKTGRKIGGGVERDGLYYFTDDVHPSSVALQSSVSPYQHHCRLGHPSLQNLKKLVPSCSRVDALPCEICNKSVGVLSAHTSWIVDLCYNQSHP